MLADYTFWSIILKHARLTGPTPLTSMFGLSKKSGGNAQRKWLESSSAGILVQNQASLITFANARIAEMLGAGGSGSIAGRSVEDFYFPSDRSVERTRIESLGTTPATQFDRRLRRADGSEIWVLTCSNAIESGAVLSLMIGITERKNTSGAVRQGPELFEPSPAALA